MSYEVIWGDGHMRMVSTADELDAVLGEVAAQADRNNLPFSVTVIPKGYEGTSYFDDDFPDCIEIGVGHPERSFIQWHGECGGYAFEPGLDPGPEGVRYDYGGQPVYPEPSQLRVTPRAARLAAGEFVRTGRRPTGVSWDRQV